MSEKTTKATDKYYKFKIEYDTFPRTSRAFCDSLREIGLYEYLLETSVVESMAAAISDNPVEDEKTLKINVTNVVNNTRTEVTKRVDKEKPFNPTAGVEDENMEAKTTRIKCEYQDYKIREANRKIKERMSNNHTKALASLRQSLGGQLENEPFVKTAKTVGELFDKFVDTFNQTKNARTQAQENIVANLRYDPKKGNIHDFMKNFGIQMSRYLDLAEVEVSNGKQKLMFYNSLGSAPSTSEVKISSTASRMRDLNDEKVTYAEILQQFLMQPFAEDSDDKTQLEKANIVSVEHSPRRSRAGEPNRKNLTCYECGKDGHNRNSCHWNPFNERGRIPGKDAPEWVQAFQNSDKGRESNPDGYIPFMERQRGAGPPKRKRKNDEPHELNPYKSINPEN